MAQRMASLWQAPHLCRRWWVVSRPAPFHSTRRVNFATATETAAPAVATGAKVKYEAVIGIETHVQLQTKTKMFCSCENSYGAEPNTHVCPVCYGEPGTLPLLNQHAVQLGITAGLGLSCKIARQSNFDRKQYFYPDLPKGYQISQYETPLCGEGEIQIEVPGSEPKRIGITRAHLEEDAGKLVHAGSDRLSGSSHSLVDYNRAGLPLLEIVSEPDMRSGKEAAAYGAELRRIVRFLGVSDGNMAEGSMRCDVNVSVRPEGFSKLGTKVEVKNLNSFANMQKAIDFEINRQVALIEEGKAEEVVQETRLWDEGRLVTYSMRKKEGLADYRYFPEPDLPPLVVSEEQLEQIKSSMAELPAQKRERYMQLDLPKADTLILADDLGTANFFDAVLSTGKVLPKAAANWIIGDIAAYCNEQKLSMENLPMKPEVLAEMIALIDDGTISGKIAKEVLPELLQGKANEAGVRKFVEAQGLVQISDPGAIGELVDQVLAANPKQLDQYKGGKTKLRGFFSGQVMKASGGRANPKLLDAILTQKLDQQ